MKISDKNLEFYFQPRVLFCFGKKRLSIKLEFSLFFGFSLKFLFFFFFFFSLPFRKNGTKNLWVLWSNSCYMLLKFLCESVCVRVRVCVCLHVCECVRVRVCVRCKPGRAWVFEFLVRNANAKLGRSIQEQTRAWEKGWERERKQHQSRRYFALRHVALFPFLPLSLSHSLLLTHQEKGLQSWIQTWIFPNRRLLHLEILSLDS